MTASAVRPDSPYKGLAPFDDSDLDALLFFGREHERDVVAANLVAARLTVLYGPSGVGKTSLLRAAVVRGLRELPERPVVVFHSSWTEGDPASAVTEAVASAADVEPGESLTETVEAAIVARGELYLILDQLEEYFLYHSSDQGPGTLAEALPELVARREVPAHVLLGIREDTLARLDAFKARMPGLFSNSIRLDHLDREAARKAIVGPVERFAELAPQDAPAIEPELVDAVLDGVETGKLVHGQGGRGVVKSDGRQRRVETPYLQLVMLRLWEAEQAEGSRILRLATLERLGGAGRIVEDHLERALSALEPAQKAMAARLFRHLVTPSGTKIAHAASDLAEYAGASEEELAGVLGSLTRERIVKPAAGDGGADAHEIYHDVLAGAVLAWRVRYEAESAIARERQAARRRHKQLLLLVFGALVALAGMAAITVYALSERRDARNQASLAREQATLVRARELGATARAQLPNDPELSLLLAREAARISPSQQAEAVLRDALIASKVRGTLRARGLVNSAAYSPDGSTIAAASEDGVVRIYDARTSKLLRALDQGTAATKIAFGPGGKRLLVGGGDGVAREWNVVTGKRLRTLRNGFARIQSVAFSRDGKGVMTAGGRRVRVWAGTDPVASVRHATPVRSALLSPNGRLVLTIASDRTARIWSVDGRRAYTIRQATRITSAAFSAGGGLLATGGADGTVRLWSGVDGKFLRVLVGHVGPVLGISFSPRFLLATASADGTARVWNTSTGEIDAILALHTNPVLSATFSSDGFSIVTASADRTARVWKPTAGSPRVVLAGHTDTVRGAVFSPDRRRVLTWSDDHTARVWDPQAQPQLRLVARLGSPVVAAALGRNGRVLLAATARGAVVVDTVSGRRSRTLGAGVPADGVALSADGSLAAVAGRSGILLYRVATGRVVRKLTAVASRAVAFAPDGQSVAAADGADVRIWALGGRELRALPGGGQVTSVTFSSDGARVAGGSTDNDARIWETASGRLLRTLEGHADDVTAVAFSADGSQLATAGRDHRARIWGARSGESRHVLVGHFATVSGVAYSPDSRWVVTAGPSTAGLWEASSGRLLFFLRGHQPARKLRAAFFDSSGTRIVTAAEDGTIRTWRCDICPGIQGLATLAERRLEATGRSLTPGERRLYIG